MNGRPSLSLRERLGLRLLLIRCYYPLFFAHKPLCTRFRHRTLRLGRIYLCRACCSLALGVFMAFLVVWTGKPQELGQITSLTLYVILVSYPPLHKTMPPFLADLHRFLLGVAGSFIVAGIFGPKPISHALLGTSLLLVHLVYTSQRKREHRNACQGCPELEQAGVCSGFILRAECSRTFDDAAARLLKS